MRSIRRMPRMQVYLTDELFLEVKQRGLKASELLQTAVRAEVARLQALEQSQRYVDELATEVGEPSAAQQAHAQAIARRIRERTIGQAS
jgi:post-segregation antitoxin (ccd killing protein)